jgi:hypothetical protein
MNQQAAPFFAGMLVCLAVFLAIILVIQILFLLTLHRTMKAVDERNREFAPGMVWLTLIPLVGSIWVLFMVPKIVNSLRREFEDRGWGTEGEGFGRIPGLIWAWGGLVSIVISVAQNAAQIGGQMELSMLISLVSLPVSLTILVCWIIFWVQMAQYGARLREGGRGYKPGSLEEDYDEYHRPRRDEDEFDRYESDRPGRERDDR